MLLLPTVFTTSDSMLLRSQKTALYPTFSNSLSTASKTISAQPTLSPKLNHPPILQRLPHQAWPFAHSITFSANLSHILTESSIQHHRILPVTIIICPYPHKLAHTTFTIPNPMLFLSPHPALYPTSRSSLLPSATKTISTQR